MPKKNKTASQRLEEIEKWLERKRAVKAAQMVRYRAAAKKRKEAKSK